MEITTPNINSRNSYFVVKHNISKHVDKNNFVVLLKTLNEKKVEDLSLSGFQFKMRHKILNKLKKAGATSKDSAVTIGEADLDYQEQMWLDYFAGAFLGKIKKTDDHRYYIY